MRLVYKHFNGHVVGARPNSNGPIVVKEETCSFPLVTAAVAVHKPTRKAEQLYSKFLLFLKSFYHQSKLIWSEIYWAFRNWWFFFLGFGKFPGESRTIWGVPSDLEAIKYVAFNIFMRGETLFRIYPPRWLKMTNKPV